MKRNLLTTLALSISLSFGSALITPVNAQKQTSINQISSLKINSNDLKKILDENRKYTKEGHVADYIPELGKANPNDIAISVIDEKGNIISAGDSHKKFTIQSISKIISLMIAVMDNGEEYVYQRIGYYGTNQPFNHFGNLDNNGKPLNPMMNAGAIVTTASIKGEGEIPYLKILDMIRYITKNPSITINETVYLSEKETGHRNRGMFHILKNMGLIEGTEDKLDNYFKQCSIEVNAEDLAKIGYFFANNCVRFDGDTTYKNKDLARLIESQMLTAGMYDFSGEYSRQIGLPSKSGVGGGITVSVPNRKIGIGVYSPALDKQGNSIAGYHMILDLAKQYDLSIF